MTTTLSMYYLTNGLGDQQAAEQFTQAFNKFVAANDPGWGDVVIAAGVCGGAMSPRKGDINLYWWWSGSDRDDWLGHYCATATVKPQIILCTSRKMFGHAKGRGYKAIYLPIGTGPDFYPLNLERSGVGFCGTGPGHKPKEQEDIIIEPAKSYDFRWRIYIDGGRPELNQWYNSLAVVMGMTAEITLSWGIVPSRTYEVLATATPYVTYKHWAMNDELNFTYPWQSGSAGETAAMLKELIDNWQKYKREFEQYASIMLYYHSWDQRVVMLRNGVDRLL